MKRIGWALGAAALSACVATHRSGGPPVPTLLPELVHYAGSPLAGTGDAAAIATDPAQAYVLRARLYALAHAAGELHSDASRTPEAGAHSPFGALSEHVRLAAAFRGDEPIRPSADLGLAARLAQGEPARAWLAELEAAPGFERRLVAEFEGALPEGVSAALSLRTAEPIEVPGEVPLRGRAALEIARSVQGIAAVMVREEFAAEDAAEGDALAGPRVLRREYGVLDAAPELDGPPLLLEFVHPPTAAPGVALLWVVELASPPLGDAGTAHAEALQRALAEVRSSSRTALERRAQLDRTAQQTREIEDAFRALGAAQGSRVALVFLASATGAALAGDLALVADDETLQRFVREVVGSVPDAQAAAQSGATLGFVLETRAWKFLTKDMDEQPLAPEFLGLLVRHGGELARSAGAVEDVLASVGDLAGLTARIRQENRDALEDASPAVRVRSYDWLVSHASAPAGFDPLGTFVERRKALAAADESARGPQ